MPCFAGSALGSADTGRDPLVRSADLIHVVEPVDHVGEALGGEDHIDRVDVPLFVDLDQPRVQARERQRILAAKEEVPLRLDPEQSGQPLELALV